MITEGKFKCGGNKPQPESSTRPPPPKPANPKSIAENSQQVLWQSYCDKKTECEFYRELLQEASILLTQGTEDHCKELSAKIIEVLNK